MRRSFHKSENELRFAIDGRISIDSPFSVVGAFGDDEQLMRLFARVYELGRSDKATEIREVLGVKEPRP